MLLHEEKFEVDDDSGEAERLPAEVVSIKMTSLFVGKFIFIDTEKEENIKTLKKKMLSQ